MLLKHNDILKVIAIITMLLDHIGLVFFPQLAFLRIIGRIAFPIFAYQLTIGYRHTSNKRRYMSRLWIFAIISQIPYTLLFDTFDFNIMFTLLLSIVLMDQVTKGRWMWVFVGLAVVTIPEYIPNIPEFDYHWYGILAPLLFHWFYHSKEKALISQVLLVLAYIALGNWTVQVFALLGVLICLYLPKDAFKVHLNKYFFYWFYPAHLLILFVALQIVIL